MQLRSGPIINKHIKRANHQANAPPNNYNELGLNKEILDTISTAPPKSKKINNETSSKLKMFVLRKTAFRKLKTAKD